MHRYPLIIGGTVAGIAGVLAFPTAHHSLTLPSSLGVTTTTTPAGGSASSATSIPSAANGATTTTGGSSSSGSTSPRTATSDDQSFRYGDMRVTVTVSGTKITNVTIASISETDGRSQQIDQFAVPQLEQQVITAGSVNIDGVSGATFSSQAFVDGVANALSKLGISP